MNKKITLLILGYLFLIGAQSIAQEKGQIRVGASLAMGTKATINDTGNSKLGMGINIGGDYFIIDNLSFSPNYSSFFKSSYYPETFAPPSGFGVKYSLHFSSLNIDGKYYFLTEKINLYGLLGFSFTRKKTRASYINVPNNIDLLPFPDDVNNNIGINIGAGVDFDLSDKFFLNGQVKYNTPLEQLVIGVGVGYVIK